MLTDPSSGQWKPFLVCLRSFLLSLVRSFLLSFFRSFLLSFSFVLSFFHYFFLCSLSPSLSLSPLSLSLFSSLVFCLLLHISVSLRIESKRMQFGATTSLTTIRMYKNSPTTQVLTRQTKSNCSVLSGREVARPSEVLRNNISFPKNFRLNYQQKSRYKSWDVF